MRRLHVNQFSNDRTDDIRPALADSVRLCRAGNRLRGTPGPTLRRFEVGVDLRTGACGGFDTCGLGDPGDSRRETCAGLGVVGCFPAAWAQVA